MANKIVDVFLGDRLVESYNIESNVQNAAASDQDYIDRAKERLRVDRYTARQIADAKFLIRSIPN